MLRQGGGGLAAFIHVGIDEELAATDGAPAGGQGGARAADQRAAPAAHPRPRPAPLLGRVPAAPPADEELPRGAGAGARRGLRQPLHDREAARPVHGRGRGSAQRAGRSGRHRHRQRAPLRGERAPAAVAGRRRRRPGSPPGDALRRGCADADRRADRRPHGGRRDLAAHGAASRDGRLHDVGAERRGAERPDRPAVRARGQPGTRCARPGRRRRHHGSLRHGVRDPQPAHRLGPVPRDPAARNALGQRRGHRRPQGRRRPVRPHRSPRW